MGEQVRARNLDSWVERHGHGPAVPIIAELGDPVEAWQLQLDELSDRYRLTAHYTREVGAHAYPTGTRSRCSPRPRTPPRCWRRSRSQPPPWSARSGGSVMARSSPCGIPNWSAAWLLAVRNQETKAVG
jgi:hypothetical protein